MGTTRRNLLAATLLGRVADAAMQSSRLNQIRAHLNAHASREKLPGISFAIAVNGRMMVSDSMGLADLESRVAATSRSVYRLCSISKALSVVAALQLVESDQLSLDEPIRTYIQAIPEAWSRITVRHLIGHRSGIRHYRDEAEVHQTKHYQQLEDALEIFRDDPLLFESGTKVQYSTFAYTVLGVVIERASGKSFPVYMREHVFRPAGMENSREDDVWALVPNRVSGYRLDSHGRHLNCRLEDPSYKYPGGGLLSTAEDVVRFALAVRNGVLLRSDTVERLFTRDPGYGSLGWDVEEREGIKVVGHTGGGEGFITDFRMVPDAGLAVAVLGNNEDSRLNADPLIKMLLAKRA